MNEIHLSAAKLGSLVQQAALLQSEGVLKDWQYGQILGIVSDGLKTLERRVFEIEANRMFTEDAAKKLLDKYPW